jgi:hypothetical protein
MPRVNVATAVNASASLSVRVRSRAATTAMDWVDTVSRNQLPLMPPCRPGLSRWMTTAMRVV